MMKKVVSFMLFVCLAVGITGVSFGAERATSKEAEAMVKKAVAYIKANGKDKAFAEFNNHQGKFTVKDLYITAYDLNGKCLAHGQNAKMVGKDLLELKDADGKFLIKERMETAKTKGKGWQDYKYTNPLSKSIEQKTTYFEKYEDIVVAGGVYK
ncbi:MAG: cache domain-containing protein [Geobacteraceae bacterium]|nr:cache domain-containing protein [Geobacteraceae bacterium]